MLQIRKMALDLIYPREASCAICGEDADGKGVSVCKRCEKQVTAKNIVRFDIEGVSSLSAAFAYEPPINSLIHSFKYGNKRYLSRYFAANIVPLLPNDEYEIVDVPLHPERRKLRGFSQTEELCGEIAFLSGRKYLQNALIRTRDTPSQVNLGAAERKANIEDAFYAKPIVSGKKIIIVDDVATTGSTIGECAKALLIAGALDVVAVVVATQDGDMDNEYK